MEFESEFHGSRATSFALMRARSSPCDSINRPGITPRQEQSGFRVGLYLPDLADGVKEGDVYCDEDGGG